MQAFNEIEIACVFFTLWFVHTSKASIKVSGTCSKSPILQTGRKPYIHLTMQASNTVEIN
jgi:hypothetical protein